MIETFESITQYNKKFDKLFNNKNHKGFSCGFFSILTAYRFMKDVKYDKFTHEQNIEDALKYTIDKKIFGGINFDLLLSTTSTLNKKNIVATSVELVNTGILGYESMFDLNNLEKYCVIFLKNEKYFVVMYLKSEKKYFLRDCHESIQYTFDTTDQLINRLDTAYQFKDNINLLGSEYISYSSIEFIQITNEFNQYISNIIIKKEIEIEENNKKSVDVNTCEINKEDYDLKKIIYDSIENKLKLDWEDITNDNQEKEEELIKKNFYKEVENLTKNPVYLEDCDLVLY
jgi:hypothetical protein